MGIQPSKGEENLLIPVHAYPVIDDLHIPAHIDLSAVPLGQRCVGFLPAQGLICLFVFLTSECRIPAQKHVFSSFVFSVQRTIPLRCSCPVDFEFQVLVIQSHEAFSVQPLSGAAS